MSLQLCVRGVRGREKRGRDRGKRRGEKEEGEGEGGEGGGGRLLKAFPRVDMEGDCLKFSPEWTWRETHLKLRVPCESGKSCKLQEKSSGTRSACRFVLNPISHPMAQVHLSEENQWLFKTN